MSYQLNPYKNYYDSDSEINWGNFWGNFWNDIFSLRIKPPRPTQDRITSRETSDKAGFQNQGYNMAKFSLSKISPNFYKARFRHPE